MFNNILGKTKKEMNKDAGKSVLIEKISRMNLTDMRIYVNNQLNDFKIDEDGLNEVMRRLISKDEHDNRFIESDSMDIKKKKAFDLVILVASNKKITIIATELIQKFINLYNDIIIKLVIYINSHIT